MMKNIAIPLKFIGPIKIIDSSFEYEVTVPLATFEKALWPSVKRGAKVSVLSGGIKTIVIKNNMTKSILLEAPDANYAFDLIQELSFLKNALNEIVSKTSRFVKLQNWNCQLVGNLIYIRLEMQTGDAAGHNMTTKASDKIIEFLLQKYNQLKYISVSGNCCVDKKVSAINCILGRGKYVIAEALIPEKICLKNLRTTPQKIVELNIKKNLIGSIISGGVATANAHFANILLSFYLATGQDAANIVEGSQGITYTEVRNNDLYFSVTIPNIIVGTIGNGKDFDFVRENIEFLGCNENKATGENSIKLAKIVAATIWCGELSLLAAQTNQGELMRAHTIFERNSYLQY